MKKITKDTILLVCKSLDFPLQQAKAIMAVESSGKGYDDKTGKIKIQFEPHIFHQQLAYQKIDHSFDVTYKVVGGQNVIDKYKISAKVGDELIVIENGVEGQSAEWEAYEKAVLIHELSAKLSTSWGLGQIMGFNAIIAGYASVSEMVRLFMDDEGEQLKGMLSFIMNKPRLMKAVRDADAATFASMYNGKNYRKYNYDARLKEAGF